VKIFIRFLPFFNLSKGPTVGNKKDSEDVRNKVIQLYTLLVSSPEFQLA